MIDNRFDPYKNYAYNFVYIDMMYIRILRSPYFENHFVSFINTYLNASRDQEKIYKFIYLTSKRITFNYNSTLVFNNDTLLYELSPP